MDEQPNRITGTNGMNPWRAGCGENRTSGSEGGPRKRTEGDLGTAPRSDPYTRLQGPTRGVFYDLYVIIDIYSRYVVSWMVAPSENAERWLATSSPTRSPPRASTRAS
jgi:transposase InsO family protein